MITLKNASIKAPKVDPEKQLCKCDNCGERKPMDEFEPLDGDWYCRVEAGGEVPAAICDKCNCLAYLVKTKEEASGEYDPAKNAQRFVWAEDGGGEVVIEVTGGVAEVTKCPSSVTETIIDRDSQEESE